MTTVENVDSPAHATRAPAPVLVVDRLCVDYGGLRALHEVSMAVRAGSTTAVIGANGAGKSSLARTLVGLTKPSSGTVSFQGEDITGRAPHLVRRRGVVYLPEERGISRGLTVLDNLRLAAEVLPSREERRTAVPTALDLFPVLADRRGQLARTLSGGEQQMLALARAFIGRPELLIVDEMSLGLAPKMVDAVFNSLDDVRKLGTTIILIEQFVHRALGFADECVILRRGGLAWAGTAVAARDEVSGQYFGGPGGSAEAGATP